MSKSRIVFKDSEDGTVDIELFHNPKVEFNTVQTPAQKFAILVHRSLIEANNKAEEAHYDD